MHTTIRHLMTIGACLAGLGALASEATADSAVSATTLGAYAPTNAAILYGTVSTGGAPVKWAFEWGTTAKYGNFTPVQTISAGASAPQAVDAVLTGLRPGTTYHFELIAADGADYSLGAYGGDKTFTTPPAGNVQLQSTSFKARKGAVSVPIKCASSQSCTGKLTITTTSKAGRKTSTLTCASKSFSDKPGSAQNVSVKLARACTTAARKGRKLSGKLLVAPTSGQPRLNKNIVIAL
jgi:hypothetical protein